MDNFKRLSLASHGNLIVTVRTRSSADGSYLSSGRGNTTGYSSRARKLIDANLVSYERIRLILARDPLE